MPLQSVKYAPGKLEILDQLLLPVQSKYLAVKGVEDGWKAINKMQVRGAPAIAIVGCLSLAVEIFPDTYDSKKTLRQEIEGKLNYLVSARPTAVNMKIAADELIALANDLTKDDSINVEQMKERFLAATEAMLQKDIDDNRAIGANGASIILKNLKKEGPVRILTHCNTGSLATAGYGTALGVVRKLHELKKLEHVYCTETRPYNQGARLTAYELVHDQLPATLVLDSMVAALLRAKNIAAVVVGADRVAANGDTANKIGTYQIAVIARHHDVPFFVAAPLTSIDLQIPSGDHIIIEERPDREMTHVGEHRIAAPGINCWNPAFDVTPASLISGIITERGVFSPQKLKSEITAFLEALTYLSIVEVANTIQQPLNVETNYRNMRLRLNKSHVDGVNEGTVREGRVEVSFDLGQSWGTICGTYWSFREANVVCRQLNLGYAVSTVQSLTYGDSKRYPWKMVGTLCRGTEASLRDCFREKDYPKFCDSSNTKLAVVRCVEKLSDLNLDLAVTEMSAFLDTRPLSNLTCAMEEKCLAPDAYEIRTSQPDAERKLLRFSTRAENVGTADFNPYANYANWQWHQCHEHYHSMETFATFDIYDRHYKKQAEGHKASFCLRDTGCRTGITPRYTCGNVTQGITVGCWDTYNTQLDCQWLDVTNLAKNNTYILRVALNPDYLIGEMSYENNGAECLLYYTGNQSTTTLSQCVRAPLWFAN
ncbi:hypothetical protein GQX74_011700 [Glossina fuscipes]|nr:hypothetical protein GQX74_011700 [Glossina fuscipes]